MDFLKKHYEKLILALCMLGLLYGVFTVSQNSQKIEGELRKSGEEAERALMVNGDVPRESAAKYSVNNYVLDSTKKISVVHSKADKDYDAGKASLLAPEDLICCPGSENKPCGQQIPLSSSECPFCHVKLPPLGQKRTNADDLDGDGIPDVVEMDPKYEGILHWRNPADAALDWDQDGFSNLEEYRAGTDLTSADSFPPLAHLTRVFKTQKIYLYLKLSTAQREEGTVAFLYMYRNQRRGRVEVKVGEEIVFKNRGAVIYKPGYKVSNLTWESGEYEDIPVVEVVSVTNPSEKYIFQPTTRTPVDTGRYQASFLFLSSKDPQQLQKMLKESPRNVEVNQEFQIARPKESDPEYKERYLLRALDFEENGAGKGRLLRARVMPLGLKQKDEIVIPVFDRNADLDKEKQVVGEMDLME